MSERICGIYMIRNKFNGKVYIGQSVNIRARIVNHKWKLANNRHGNSHLQAAYNKYGKGYFSSKVLEKCNEKDLDRRENAWIIYCKALDNKKGYNVQDPSKENKHINKKNKNSRKKLKPKHSDILQINRKGEIVKKWDRLSSITKELGFSYEKVRDCITGYVMVKGRKKIRYSYKDFKWVTQEQYDTGNYVKGFHEQTGSKYKMCTIKVYKDDILINTFYCKKDLIKSGLGFSHDDSYGLGLYYKTLIKKNIKAEIDISKSEEIRYKDFLTDSSSSYNKKYKNIYNPSIYQKWDDEGNLLGEYKSRKELKDAGYTYTSVLATTKGYRIRKGKKHIKTHYKGFKWTRRKNPNPFTVEVR